MQEIFDNLTPIVQGAENFRVLRELWSMVDHPAIPLLGKNNNNIIIIIRLPRNYKK